MQQKLKVVHADTPGGFQSALNELEKQYSSWVVVKMDLSTCLFGGFTALVLLERKKDEKV